MQLKIHKFQNWQQAQDTLKAPGTPKQAADVATGPVETPKGEDQVVETPKGEGQVVETPKGEGQRVETPKGEGQRVETPKGEGEGREGPKPANPPEQLTDGAINARLRRLMKPRADGSTLVPQEVIDEYRNADTQDKVKSLFERCGYNKDQEHKHLYHGHQNIGLSSSCWLYYLLVGVLSLKKIE